MGHAIKKQPTHLQLVPVTTGFQGQEQGERADLRTRFRPGKSGNPAGRPKGSKHKLEEAFISDLHASWLDGGRAVLERVAKEFPVEYVKICVSILPKGGGMGDAHGPDAMLQEMSDEQLAATMDMLQRLIRVEKMLTQEVKRPA